jgi:hypothetical protein
VPGTPLVTVCVVPSSFDQVIVAPFATLGWLGLKAKPLIEICAPATAGEVAGVDAHPTARTPSSSATPSSLARYRTSSSDYFTVIVATIRGCTLQK